MLKKEWLNSRQLTLWQKIRLFFTTKEVSVDISKNNATIMWYKKIDDMIVIVKH